MVIDLTANGSTCKSKCQEFVDYIAGYTSPTEMILAVILARDYKDGDDYFTKAFDKRTRYDYRKIAEDGYIFKKLTAQERISRLEELYAINTSADERQGGKMNDTYYEFPKIREENSFPHHFIQI